MFFHEFFSIGLMSGITYRIATKQKFGKIVPKTSDCLENLKKNEKRIDERKTLEVFYSSNLRQRCLYIQCLKFCEH